MNAKKIASIALLAGSLVAVGAAPASADGLLDLTSCSSAQGKQAFSRWLDPLTYRLAPGGAFESSADGWQLSGGANVVTGNETYYLNSASDTQAASLGAGSSATSPETCVSLYDPALRFVARSTGSVLGVLKVDALYRDQNGALDVVPVGVVTGLGSSWQPSLPMVLALGVVPSAGQDATNVRFRFTVTGVGGAFQIDDVFVDPYGRR